MQSGDWNAPAPGVPVASQGVGPMPSHRVTRHQPPRRCPAPITTGETAATMTSRMTGAGASARVQWDSQPKPRRLGLALVLVRELREVCRSAGEGHPPEMALDEAVRSGMRICIGRDRMGVAGGVRTTERLAPGLLKADEGIGGTGGMESVIC